MKSKATEAKTVMLKTTLRLPADLMRQAKIYAVKTDASLQDIVEAALRTYLARKDAKEGN
jgi:predicted transcriptional regulator